MVQSGVDEGSEVLHSHFHDLASMLLKMMQIGSMDSTSHALSPPERRKMVHEAGSISKSLGAGVRVSPDSHDRVFLSLTRLAAGRDYRSIHRSMGRPGIMVSSSYPYLVVSQVHGAIVLVGKKWIDVIPITIGLLIFLIFLFEK